MSPPRTVNEEVGLVCVVVLVTVTVHLEPLAGAFSKGETSPKPGSTISEPIPSTGEVNEVDPATRKSAGSVLK